MSKSTLPHPTFSVYPPIASVRSSYLNPEFEKACEQEFHQLLREAKAKLSQHEWCKLFYGKYGIPFQVMDNKELHTEFCTTCPDRVTEVFEEFKKESIGGVLLSTSSQQRASPY